MAPGTGPASGQDGQLAGGGVVWGGGVDLLSAIHTNTHIIFVCWHCTRQLLLTPHSNVSEKYFNLKKNEKAVTVETKLATNTGMSKNTAELGVCLHVWNLA